MVPAPHFLPELSHDMKHPSAIDGVLASLAVLSLVAACGGEDSTSVGGAPVETETGELAPSPEPAPAEPTPAEPADEKPVSPPGTASPSAAFLLHSAVEGESGRLNYFTPVGAIAAAEQVSYEGSLELPGRARLYAEPGVGYFAIGDAEGVSLQRYELVDGRFVPGAELSLQPYGVSSLGAQAVLFASPTRAYYKDAGQGLIIAWNPRDMTIEQVLELPPSVVRDGYVLGMSDWVRRDDEAFFALGWSTPEYDRVLPGAALVRLDLNTNELGLAEDARCRGLQTTTNLDGTLYFFSDVINGFGHAVYPGDAGQQDCSLRILPGAAAFDPDYVGSIAGALPPNTSGTVVAVTQQGELWAQVVDLAVAPTSPGSTYGEWYADGWSWWHLPMAAGEGAVRVAQPAGAYSGSAVTVGSSLFISQTTPDYSSTTLLDVSGAEPVPGLSFAGFTLDVAQLR
jgi:hypothetical protein